MKLTGIAAVRYFARPEPGRAGLLIYGSDPMRVALRRQEVIAALIGPEGEAEMRLTRIAAGDLRRDPALAGDALREQGFFPGQRVVFVEDAGDSLVDTLRAALQSWRDGDATLVVTAGVLPARSPLRKAFEDHPNAYSAGIYDDPPSREEIEEMLRKSGLVDVGRSAMADLVALSRELDPGDLRQTIEKVALYKHGDPHPLSSEDVAACAPASIDAEVDDVLHAAAERHPARVGPVIRRLEDQGVTPVSLCIGALRHFRALHAAACDPQGPGAGLARMRPPVFGPRKDRMQRQAETWGVPALEEAITLLVDTDLALRSSSRAPPMAVVERALIRLSMKR